MGDKRVTCPVCRREGIRLNRKGELSSHVSVLKKHREKGEKRSTCWMTGRAYRPVGVILPMLADRSIGYLGNGYILEEVIPPEHAAGVLSEQYRLAAQLTPKIVLESGETVYGCECIIDSVGGTERTLARAAARGVEIRHASIEELRDQMTERE